MIERWGIRARVTFVAFVPMLVVAALMTATHTSLRLSDLDQTLRARAQAHARQLAAASEYAIFAGDRETLGQLADALMLEDDVAAIAILGADGKVLVRAGRFGATLPPADQPAPTLTLDTAEGRWLRIVEPITPSHLPAEDAFSGGMAQTKVVQAPLGQLVIDMSLERMQQRRSELLRIAAGWMVLAAAGSLLLARRMSRSVSGPIREAAEAVLSIGRGQLHRRVRVSGGGSLRALAEGVNEMAERLEDAHASMARRIDEATAELRARKDEAERANLAKSRFLAAASHDLRQPLHALGLFLSELNEQPLDARSRQLTGRLTASTEAMEGLLDSLLDISRLDAGVLTPKPAVFDMHAKLEHLLAGQASAAAARGLDLRLHCPPCWGVSDPLLFERIVANLVGNAIRYTPHGRVLVACRRRGERLRVEVRDSGLGIAADDQQVIFQEFVQLGNVERARDKGLGLGLAIVRRLVNLLGHRLELRSALGRGSVFAIELPAAAPPDPVPGDREALALGHFDGLQVMLADDDALALSAMSSLLASWGCEVTAAHTADELLDALASRSAPDILITDLRLGGATDGLALIAAVRAQTGQAGLPAVLISGDTAPESLARIQAAGVPLLHKPVRPARMRALMHRLLTRH
jgi:signal transduction histidine kinase/CheY-like chemotaxis protein